MKNSNFYEEKIQEIKDLIENQKYMDAFVQLQTELGMPYVPAIYEEQFYQLLLKLQSVMSDLKAPSATMHSMDEILENLFSDDPDHQMMALDNLGAHNLHGVATKLKQRIESWPPMTMRKGFLFEMMIQQKIDVDVVFDENNILNPSKSTTLYDNENVAEMFNKIQELTFKDPAFEGYVSGEAGRYLLITYPEVPKSGSGFAQSLVNVVSHMLGKETDLNMEEMQIFQVLKNPNAL